jgi:hypothetical protein
VEPLFLHISNKIENAITALYDLEHRVLQVFQACVFLSVSVHFGHKNGPHYKKEKKEIENRNKGKYG